MNIEAILGISLAAIGVMLTVLYRLLKNAFNKGVTSKTLRDVDEKIKEYDTRHVVCTERFVKLEERKTDNNAFEAVRGDITLVKGDIALMKDDILLIKRNIEQKTLAFQSSSPIRLTDTGIKIAEDTGIYSGVDANWPAIVSALDDIVTSNNPYDVQQECFDFALLHPEITLPPENIEALKLYAFNDGTPVSYFMRVVGIVIRDKYFKHRGGEISDIDKHDPKKQ